MINPQSWPIEINKSFDKKLFLEEFLLKLDKWRSFAKNVETFQSIPINVLDKHAPENKKSVRANQANFMDTELNHAIMVRSKSRHGYLKVDQMKREKRTKNRNVRINLLIKGIILKL